MSIADCGSWVPLSNGEVREHSLEAYANAVRTYQNVVLELQDLEWRDPLAQGAILEKAEAAKRTVNFYRNAHKQGAVAAGNC